MIIDDYQASQVIKTRPNQSHKGDFGRLLLIGGLYPYGGAIIMAAMAAVYSGAGLVTVATDRENITALHSHLPEAMAFDVMDTDLLIDQLENAEVVLLGSGLGLTQQAKAIFDLVLEHISPEKTLVLDGSALTLLAKGEQKLSKEQKLILTPHQKEWQVLSGLEIAEQVSDANQKALRTFPKGTILVAKKPNSEVYQGSIRYQIFVGGPYQATGGMGDTLAGMIAGFVGQFKTDSLLTVAVATYLHSKIADDLSETAYVTLPTAISCSLPTYMAQFSKSK